MILESMSDHELPPTAMYYCSAYGLVIQSEHPLLDPLPAAVSPDVVVRWSPIPNVPQESPGGDTVYARLPGVTFLIQAGTTITVDADTTIDLSILRAYILGAAMAVILQQRGYLVLHASCVAIQDQAIAFIGASGWGKSTLASALHARGHTLLTDDVLAIDMAGHGPMGIPSFPEVKLLSDSAIAIDPAATHQSFLHSLSKKQIRRLDQGFSQKPVPLRQLYLLSIAAHNSIESLPPQLTFTTLLQHSRATKTLSDPTFQVEHFRACSELARRVPMAHLKRRRSLAQLPQVMTLIEEHLGVLTSPLLP